MDETEHNLILDYRPGSFQARCSCGGWLRTGMTPRVQRLPEVYDGIEAEHGRHVEEAESRRLALT
jgi:hypothetical protein